MKQELIDIKGMKLPFLIKDNQVKKTILMIHGFNSSADFCEKLFKIKNNYNIISLDLPGSNTNSSTKSWTIEEISDIVNTFINLINMKVYVLGHSLAGGILTKIYDNPRIKGLIFLSTIHPKLTLVKTYKILEKYNNPNSRISKIRIDKFINSPKNVVTKWINAFVKPCKGFDYILKNQMFNKKYIEQTLDKEFKSINKKMIFGVGSHDFIIGTKYFEDYVKNTLNKKMVFFPAGHNPIKDKPHLVNEWLNSNYRKKNRFFIKKLKINK